MAGDHRSGGRGEPSNDGFIPTAISGAHGTSGRACGGATPSADAGVVLQIALEGLPDGDGNGSLGCDSHKSRDGLGDYGVSARRQSQEVVAVRVADRSSNFVAGRVQREDRRSRDGTNARTLAGLFDWAGGSGQDDAANSGGEQGRDRRAGRWTGSGVAGRECQDQGSEADEGTHASPACCTCGARLRAHFKPQQLRWLSSQ